MNPFSYESELLAFALLLYLYDSSLLLFANEALLIAADPKRWSARWGFTGFVIAGKSLCMLNPFTPHHAAFLLRWRLPGDARAQDPSWTGRVESLARLKLSTLSCALGLFAALPLGLFTRLGRYAWAPALVLIYGSSALGLVRLWAVRDALSLPGRRFAAFAFECLVCPPFGANMLRRLALAQKIDEPLIGAAARLAAGESRQRLFLYCATRIDEELQNGDPDAAQRAALEARKVELGRLAESLSP